MAVAAAAALTFLGGGGSITSLVALAPQRVRKGRRGSLVRPPRVATAAASAAAPAPTATATDRMLPIAWGTRWRWGLTLLHGLLSCHRTLGSQEGKHAPATPPPIQGLSANDTHPVAGLKTQPCRTLLFQNAPMDSGDVLSVLRGAARELSAYRSSSQPGTPTAGSGGDAAAAGLPAAPAPSQAQMLLQIAALHKAFLALSEAFLEEQEARQAERTDTIKVRRRAMAAWTDANAIELPTTQRFRAPVPFTSVGLLESTSLNVFRPLVQQAASAQAEAAQLAAAQGQHAHSQAMLAQRCSHLEQEVAR